MPGTETYDQSHRHRRHSAQAVPVMTSYHVGLQEQTEVLLAVATEFLQDPFPAWTAVGVTDIIDAEALIEISCLARP